MWVLGTKLQPFTEAASALNCRAFPQPESFPHCLGCGQHLVLVLACLALVERSSLEPSLQSPLCPRACCPGPAEGASNKADLQRPPLRAQRVELSSLRSPRLTQGFCGCLLGLSRFFQYVSYETFYRKSEGRRKSVRTQRPPHLLTRVTGGMKPVLTVISINI